MLVHISPVVTNGNEGFTKGYMMKHKVMVLNRPQKDLDVYDYYSAIALFNQTFRA